MQLLTLEQRRALDELFARNGGKVDESQVVNAARPADSPLHDLFPWSDREASRLYRLQRARQILRGYVAWSEFRKRRNMKSLKCFQQPVAAQVCEEEGKPKKWVKFEIVLQDEYMKTQVISQRLTVLRRAVNGIRVIPELVPLAEMLQSEIDAYRVPGAIGELEKTAAGV